MAKLALLISIIALAVALLAYQEAGGTRALRETVRTLQGALDVARKESAEALARVEQALRASDSEPARRPPAAKP